MLAKNRILHAKQVNLKEVASALIVAPYNPSDFILATPAIAALKQSLSSAGRLTVVVSREVRALAEKVKSIDRVMPMSGPAAIGTAFNALIGGYEVLVNMEPDRTSSMLISMLCGARAKVAYALKNEKKMHNKLHNLKLHTIDTPEHKTIEYLNLVRFIGANSYEFEHKLVITDADKKYAMDFLKKNEITDKDVLIGIHPVLQDESKRWAINKFHQLVRNLVEKYNARVVVYYHEEEKDRLEEFMHVIRNKAVLVDTTDYGKLMALSAYFTCFICNETDFMHLLAPYTNLIVIWGATDPETNKPAGACHEIIKPVGGSADSVPVSTVTEMVKKFLGDPVS